MLMENRQKNNGTIGPWWECYDTWHQTRDQADIAFAVHQCARFSHCPMVSHEGAIKRICRYLKGTMKEGIVFTPSEELAIDCYVDSDFAGLYGTEDSHDPICAKVQDRIRHNVSRMSATMGIKATDHYSPIYYGSRIPGFISKLSGPNPITTYSQGSLGCPEDKWIFHSTITLEDI